MIAIKDLRRRGKRSNRETSSSCIRFFAIEDIIIRQPTVLIHQILVHIIRIAFAIQFLAQALKQHLFNSRSANGCIALRFLCHCRRQINHDAHNALSLRRKLYHTPLALRNAGHPTPRSQFTNNPPLFTPMSSLFNPLFQESPLRNTAFIPFLRCMHRKLGFAQPPPFT